MKNILLIIITIFFFSCTLDNNSIRKGWWKHCGDDHVLRDFISFDENNLRHDTIYGKTLQNNDTAIAVIYKTEKRWFADDVIYIKHLRTKQIGRYCNKGKE